MSLRESSRSRANVLAELAEDQQTSWVPDVVGEADHAALVEQHEWGTGTWPGQSRSRSVDVPRPDGRTMTVLDLTLADRLDLHTATDCLREPADDVLLPTVCGYRRGAQQDHFYRLEYQRFQDLCAAYSEEARMVLAADISSFFASTSLRTALKAAEQLVGHELTGSLHDLVERAERGPSIVHRGYRTDVLPPGYADARLLGNLVLAHVDSQIGLPFVRWVDDYRVFLGEDDDPDRAVDRLSQSLAEWGLQLNKAKLTVTEPGPTARQLNQLTSVYHPDREPLPQTRAALRQVFISATAEPVRLRRALRFALPRMAEIEDPIAIDFALRALETVPWEAPRLVAYVAQFLYDERVLSASERLLRRAARDNDIWMVARLAPLGCRLPLSRETKDALEESLTGASSPVAWGSALRMLSCSGARRVVRAAVRGPTPDPRAALAALADLGEPFDLAQDAVRRAPITAAALTSPPPPPPVSSSL
jgi:Reverse transcriptase (RNA-dependent DNA polymerase)